MNIQPASLPHFFLKPGDMAFAEQSCVISTLLGSCVAITMTSRRLGIGAICHALLPACQDRNRCNGCTELFRHVECSIRGMVEAFLVRGVPCSGIEAKLFGGADMFRTDTARDGGYSVGRQNIDKARNTLAAEGIRLVAADVGGTQGRKIIFYPHTGEVFLRRLTSMALAGGMSAARRARGQVS